MIFKDHVCFYNPNIINTYHIPVPIPYSKPMYESIKVGLATPPIDELPLRSTRQINKPTWLNNFVASIQFDSTYNLPLAITTTS